MKRASKTALCVLALIVMAMLPTFASGNVTFKRVQTTVDGYPFSVALGDVNGDGKTDAVTANPVATSVNVLLGNGGGGFTEAAGSPIGVAFNPDSVALEDVNSDGKTDALTANYTSSTVSVLLGNGSGGFSVSGSPVAAGDTPRSVTLGDLNGDHKLDAVAGSDSPGLTALLNTSQPISTLSTSAVGFASYGVNTQSGAKSVRITNTGDARLSITSVRIDGSDDDHFRKVDDACRGESLDVGESCRVLVSFAPLTWGLLDAAGLRVSSNVVTSPQRITLSGIGSPQTTITAGPRQGSTTTDNTPTFKFVTDDTHPGRSFQCSVDAGAYVACSSPRTMSALARGRLHTFRVRAKDPDGPVYDPTPASSTFKVS